MEENLALKVANRVRLSRKLTSLSYIFELFDKFDRQNIFFHNLHFDMPSQKSIIGGFINENTLNSIYIDFPTGAFDVVITYLGNRDTLYFSKKCADKAYALYMFYKMGYRITGNGVKYIMPELLGKTFEELDFPAKRRIRMHEICVHEYTVDRMYLTTGEESILKAYINEE